MLKALRTPGVYERLEEASARLEAGLREAAESVSVPVRLTRVGSLLTLFFGTGEPVDWASVAGADTKSYGIYFHRMLERGIYLAPSQFEAAFVSLAHTDEMIDRTVAAAREALKGLRWGPAA
jgi:glutamate-1-semialdehyde 2,1-aminomutase